MTPTSEFRPTVHRSSENTSPVWQTADRERAFFLATFYGWSARREGDVLPANDPTTGRRWDAYSVANRRAARASNIALARFWYAEARRFGTTPLPGAA